ncbi:MAG: AAA family ATPase [Succinivibrionaceae bacterium]
MKELSYTELLPNIPDVNTNSTSDDITFASFQKRAQSAIQELVYTEKNNPIMYLNSIGGFDVEECIKNILSNCEFLSSTLYDICYAENLNNELSPTWLHIKSGTAEEFNKLICDLLNNVKHNLNAENILLRILKKQDNNKKLENYLSDLSIHVAQGKDFTYPVLMNLLVCHEPNKPPVIFGKDLTWKKLFGGVNYLTENGTTYSHHHLLDAGLLRQADGGFLILPLEELIHNPILWFKLKNTLDSGLLDWENPTESTISIVPFFSPEPTPINVKVILVGSVSEFAELYSYDPECTNSFYIKTDINAFFNIKNHAQQFYQFIDTTVKNKNLLPFDNDSKKRLLRVCCRRSESQKEFILSEQYILNLMREASGLAKRKSVEKVSLNLLEETLNNREFRINSVVEESSDFYKNKQMLLQTDGSAVGQINGLSVIETIGDYYEYGEPVRITATIHAGGEGDIADIEHKANLAGQIHTKAMMIINGFLTNIFGASTPLPVSTNLVFEQSYSEIDGDSASLTGLCATLSALARIPILQQYALTGSLDQFGNVQPVGGLNEKIEGFYRVCKIQGLTGKQGVLIPESNIQSLVLNNEVIDAVKDGKFHIFSVKTVDDAIEILTGIKAGLTDARLIMEGKDKAEKIKRDIIKNNEGLTLYDLISEKLDEIQNGNEENISFLKKLFCFWK